MPGHQAARVLDSRVPFEKGFHEVTKLRKNADKAAEERYGSITYRQFKEKVSKKSCSYGCHESGDGAFPGFSR